jgi:hypothetical protein
MEVEGEGGKLSLKKVCESIFKPRVKHAVSDNPSLLMLTSDAATHLHPI